MTANGSALLRYAMISSVQNWKTDKIKHGSIPKNKETTRKY